MNHLHFPESALKASSHTLGTPMSLHSHVLLLNDTEQNDSTFQTVREKYLILGGMYIEVPLKYHGTLIYGNQVVCARRQDPCSDCSVI